MKNELSRRGNYSDYDFFEDAMRDFFPGFYGRRSEGHKYMRTDIKESDKGYEMEIELPGMDKKDINIDLSDGYLTISAGKSDKEENKHNYIRRERSFSCSRSYYVGDVKREDVKAKYDNGILSITIPKDEPKESGSSRIDIE